MLNFTDREIRKAWRENHEVYEQASTRTNPHRLLLFYAVECGLKAIIMSREQLNRTDENMIIAQSGHNINKLLTYLRADPKLHLKPVQMKAILFGKTRQPRTVNPSEFNQMWRYGGKAEGKILDQAIEIQLSKIIAWIKGELS